MSTATVNSRNCLDCLHLCWQLHDLYWFISINSLPPSVSVPGYMLAPSLLAQPWYIMQTRAVQFLSLGSSRPSFTPVFLVKALIRNCCPKKKFLLIKQTTSVEQADTEIHLTVNTHLFLKCMLSSPDDSMHFAFLHIFNTTTMSLFILITTLSLIRIIFFLATFVHTNKEFDFLQLVLAWQTFFLVISNLQLV